MKFLPQIIEILLLAPFAFIGVYIPLFDSGFARMISALGLSFMAFLALMYVEERFGIDFEDNIRSLLFDQKSTIGMSDRSNIGTGDANEDDSMAERRSLEEERKRLHEQAEKLARERAALEAEKRSNQRKNQPSTPPKADFCDGGNTVVRLETSNRICMINRCGEIVKGFSRQCDALI